MRLNRGNANMKKNLLASLRCTALLLLGCCGAYVPAVWCFAQLVTPDTANGSLVRNGADEVVGSRLLAQPFTSDCYFHGREAESGSGLDPHITSASARAQISRVAAARRIPAAELERMVERHGRLVNVLELNLELESRK